MLIFLSMLESDEERRLFTDLYNQYGNMMMHVAKRYFPKDMYAAEDVVQNAWIRVVDHFQKIQAVPSKKRGAYLVVIEEGSAIIIDAENMEVTEIGVNGCPGHLYISVDPEQSNCITWYDNGAKMQFIIDGFLEGNELQMLLCQIHISLNREL